MIFVAMVEFTTTMVEFSPAMLKQLLNGININDDRINIPSVVQDIIRDFWMPPVIETYTITTITPPEKLYYPRFLTQKEFAKICYRIVSRPNIILPGHLIDHVHAKAYLQALGCTPCPSGHPMLNADNFAYGCFQSRLVVCYHEPEPDNVHPKIMTWKKVIGMFHSKDWMTAYYRRTFPGHVYDPGYVPKWGHDGT